MIRIPSYFTDSMISEFLDLTPRRGVRRNEPDSRFRRGRLLVLAVRIFYDASPISTRLLRLPSLRILSTRIAPISPIFATCVPPHG